MNVSLIIVCVIAVALLILVLASKIMNILIGFIATIGGVAAYFWLGTPESWETVLKIAIEFKITPDELRTYSLIAILVGIVLLLFGVLRGRKDKKVIVVQEKKIKNAEKEDEKMEENKREEIKTEELRKVEMKVEEKREEPKKDEKSVDNKLPKTENDEKNTEKEDNKKDLKEPENK